MALREIKTNIQRRETKDESQTNGSYKIKEIIIKIMEYTHTYTPMSKVKTVNKNKAQQTDSANKGNQRLYLSAKNEMN